ncbi:MAG: hypothetical protein M1839_003184 [Geoglossum umbratile]|nr:MAG: hypothetical protein M1839_003184 [Geoglossum umbratile]
MAIPYRPLDQSRQEIRLLRQSSSIWSETLEYELIHYPFGQEQPYLALSYVWGQQELQQTISVDEKTVSVSTNLWAALRSLRDASRTTTDKEESSSDRLGSMDYIAKAMQPILRDAPGIWVDALCINQSDLGEKSRQIKLMPQIYKNASIIILWLGEGEESTKLAFDFIWNAPHDHLVELVRDNRNSKEWEALGSFLARPYWSRVWILQEVLLSRERAIVFCGSLSIPWINVALFLTKMHTGLLSVIRDTDGAATNVIWRDSKARSLAVTHLEHWRDYLVLAQSRNCSNARDKVFGVLGVCDGQDIEEFEVDYSKSVKDIFRDTTRYLIQKDRNLDVLSACKHFSNAESIIAFLIQEGCEWIRDGSALGQDKFDQVRAIFARNEETILAVKTQMDPHGYIPSWIPDWSKPVLEHIQLLLKNRDRCHFQASGDTEVRLHAADNKDWLILDGFRMGRVKTIVPWPASSDHMLDQFWQAWNRETEHGNPYGNEEAQKMAYKVTLMSGRGPLSYKDDITPSRPSVDRLLGFRGVDPDTSIDGLPQFNAAHLDNFLGGRFFITGENYMGRGPPAMESGDYICIFFGGKVPYILRQVHTRWFLIGECCKYAVFEMRT